MSCKERLFFVSKFYSNRLPLRWMVNDTMTKLLSDFLYDCGLLHITLTSLEDARDLWSQGFGQVLSEETLKAHSVKTEEPALIIVQKSDTEESSFHLPGDHDFQAIDSDGVCHTENVCVLKLPFDEYHFFSAFVPGIQDLSKELPNFLFGMVVVHAYSLFENYLAALLRLIVTSRPEMLESSKQITHGEIIECYPSMDKLIEHIAEKHIHEFSYKSLRDQLKVLRMKFGFHGLTDEYDDTLVEIALIRNCLVHNRGVVDQKLAGDYSGFYTEGDAIVADKALVDKIMMTCRHFAVALDQEAEEIHSVQRH